MAVGKADISAMNSVRSVLSGFMMPVAQVVTVPVSIVASMVDGIGSFANMRQENIRLQEKVKHLERWQREATILRSENLRLQAVSKVLVPADMGAVSSRVIAINADSFAHSMMLTAGSKSGIRKGNAVTTSDGLVGMIIEVSPYYSRVLLLSDLNAMIPVILSETSWPAVTTGRNAPLLELRFLPQEANVKIGDTIQTSGHGGVLPAGLPVGRVVSNRRNTVTVKPFVDLQRLSYVTVLIWPDDGRDFSDDVLSQTYNPIPKDEDGFSFEGINALGQQRARDRDQTRDAEAPDDTNNNGVQDQ